MNLNFDTSAVTRFFHGIANEFRNKKLWPVAAVLLAAIVAVPLLLTSSSNPPAQSQTPAPVPPPSSATTLPALDVQSTPAHSNLTGPGRDPFNAASGSGGTSSASTTPNLADVASVASIAHNAVNAMTGSSATSTGSGGGSSSTSGGSGVSFTSSPSSSSSSTFSSGSGSSSGSTTSSSTEPAKAKSTATGLTSTQSYGVSLSMTNSSGGLNAIDSLQRLSVLPSRQQPLLVELGVLKGGKRVLFAVQPGAAVKGPGTCIPGPIDCEVLSLGRNQTELVGTQSSNGVTRVALFSVTSIKVVDHSTAAAAQKARQSVSTAGRTLLRASELNALSLFQYETSLGALADLRSLTIG